jgi:sugar phosphate isomerase/epimerase
LLQLSSKEDKKEDDRMKTALHSISYTGGWGQKHLSLEDFIVKASKLGYDGVEITGKRPHASILDMNDSQVLKIDKILKENNIECAALAGYTNFTAGTEHLDIPIFEMQIDYVTKMAKIASGLGCNLVRIFTGYERKDVSYQKQWEWCKIAIKECAKRAAEYGVTIGIQNHHDIALNGYQLRDFMLEVDEPNCKVMFDAWAPTINGENIEESVNAVADMIVYTTIADYVRIPRYNYKPEIVNYERSSDIIRAVPLGEGIIDYKNYLCKLGASGFNGYVAYEMCSPLRGGGSEENLDKCAKKFIEFMRQFS